LSTSKERICGSRWKLQKRSAHQPRLIMHFIQPTRFHTIVNVSLVTFIAPPRVLFATRIFAPTIFMYVLTVTTNIAAAVLTTTAPTVTGLILIPPPN